MAPIAKLAGKSNTVPPPRTPDQDDKRLAADIVDAMKEVDAATATRNEKAVAAGKLLIEAQKRHPTENAFKEFLELAGGIQIRRARDLIALALGRKDFEQHQIENAAAQQRHRDKLKAEKIEREKAKAALPKPDPKPEPKPEPKPKPEGKGKPEPEPARPALRNADGGWRPDLNPDEARAAMSAINLREFEDACRLNLPQMNAADLEKARAFVSRMLNECRTQAKKVA
jgi:hypothetical protein